MNATPAMIDMSGPTIFPWPACFGSANSAKTSTPTTADMQTTPATLIFFLYSGIIDILPLLAWSLRKPSLCRPHMRLQERELLIDHLTRNGPLLDRHGHMRRKIVIRAKCAQLT